MYMTTKYECWINQYSFLYYYKVRLTTLKINLFFFIRFLKFKINENLKKKELNKPASVL